MRALHPLLRADRRRPVHRAGRAGRAAAGRHLREGALRVLLLRQHDPDLPGRRAHLRRVPLPSRPFDLVSTPAIAEHDACGSAIRVDHRRGKVMRRLAGNDPEVNEEWITDKDRFAFHYAPAADRLTHPLVRDEDGELRAASWPEAFTVAARGLRAAGAGGVLTGGRVTAEDAYAYSKFARVALGTNDIDFRARPLWAEEAAFLAAEVVLRQGVTYADLESAATVVLAGFEPEDEAGAVFLRLRKASMKKKGLTRVVSIAPFTTRGLAQDGWPAGGDRCPVTRLPRWPPWSATPRSVSTRRRDHGRRTARDRRPVRSRPRPTSPQERCPTGLGAAPCGRPRCGRGRLPADPAARRPTGRRRRRPGRRRNRLGVDSLPERAGRDADAIVAALQRRRAGRSGRGRCRPRRHGRPRRDQGRARPPPRSWSRSTCGRPR